VINRNQLLQTINTDKLLDVGVRIRRLCRVLIFHLGHEQGEKVICRNLARCGSGRARTRRCTCGWSRRGRCLKSRRDEPACS